MISVPHERSLRSVTESVVACFPYGKYGKKRGHCPGVWTIASFFAVFCCGAEWSSGSTGFLPYFNSAERSSIRASTCKASSPLTSRG